MTQPPATLPEPSGRFVDEKDGRYYRIDRVDQMPVFLMTLVSATDRWLFVASNGGLSAGRAHSGQALFPYQTVDRIYDSTAGVGPFTAIRCGTDRGEVLWEPFAAWPPRDAAVSRALLKSVEGDRIWFEEVHHELGLAFRYGWAVAPGYGFVRRVELRNLSDRPHRVGVLDGLRNLLPPGIGEELQNRYSCLADAYKMAERIGGTSLAAYSLASAIIDRPVAVESLRATVAWSEGIKADAILLADVQVPAFIAGREVVTEQTRRGVRGAYAIVANLDLAGGAAQEWMMVTDFGLPQAGVTALRKQLEEGDSGAAVRRAIADNTATLRQLVGSADGIQEAGDELTTVHHFANVLFNIMRGGVFADNGEVPGNDFGRFVALRNRRAAARHDSLLGALPPRMSGPELLDVVKGSADPDLERLALEYLPLTFSRRHGDPSRPWNRFHIALEDEAGNPLLEYEGNWRDIFQNWEALGLSFPTYLPHFVAKFVNASTADGYNAFRINRGGNEWEEPKANDPWAGIGYWGDHQVIYLLKLLEWADAFDPGSIHSWLRRSIFSTADVPYRIAPYSQMRKNPRRTITFDDERQRQIHEREGEVGTDARLVTGADGRVVHVNLTEKLLLVILVRLASFIPGGGIWMNTQRPEWNDANNALVGYGVSAVTLAQLRRFLAFWRSHLLPALGDGPVEVSGGVARLAREIDAALADHAAVIEMNVIDPVVRRALVDRLAQAGSEHRTALYANGIEPVEPVDHPFLAGLTERALAFVDHSLGLMRRPDGLYESYNLLTFRENPAALEVQPLQPMLEGQVAILGAGVLDASAAVGLLDSLRGGALYRADQNSYILYPDRELPGILERNRISDGAAGKVPLLDHMLKATDERVILRDADGVVRFHPDLVNEEALNRRLEALARDPQLHDLVKSSRGEIAALYEGVFHHRSFTGRSGSMFGYEGLGCIYWHMVSKLLLAVQECLQHARATGDPLADRLAGHYAAVRDGIGFRKSPKVYGAFPTDPYSHTPGHAGAQQPGMTGQVKEEVITRLGELGVSIADGRVTFDPALVDAGEFVSVPRTFAFVDVNGHERNLALDAGSLGFTFCGTPVIYRKEGGTRGLEICFADGRKVSQPDFTLDAEMSRNIFGRDGRIEAIVAAR